MLPNQRTKIFIFLEIANRNPILVLALKNSFETFLISYNLTFINSELPACSSLLYPLLFSSTSLWLATSSSLFLLRQKIPFSIYPYKFWGDLRWGSNPSLIYLVLISLVGLNYSAINKTTKKNNIPEMTFSFLFSDLKQIISSAFSIPSWPWLSWPDQIYIGLVVVFNVLCHFYRLDSFVHGVKKVAEYFPGDNSKFGSFI